MLTKAFGFFLIMPAISFIVCSFYKDEDKLASFFASMFALIVGECFFIGLYLLFN